MGTGINSTIGYGELRPHRTPHVEIPSIVVNLTLQLSVPYPVDTWWTHSHLETCLYQSSGSPGLTRSI
jgi:hypothetical protein